MDGYTKDNLVSNTTFIKTQLSLIWTFDRHARKHSKCYEKDYKHKKQTCFDLLDGTCPYFPLWAHIKQ